MKKLMYVMMSLLFILSSCEKDSLDEERVNVKVQEDVTLAEQNSIKGETLTINYGDKILDVTDEGSFYLFEGDIMIPKQEGKAAAIVEGRWWQTNTIPYSIDPNLASKERVYNAIAHYEKTTNLRFVERTTEVAYLYFVTGSGCSSYVGRTGGKQPISLSTGCSTGNTIHEIGHAVGLWHEQSRADRDEFIIVHMENVRSGYEHNFYKYTQTGSGGVDLTSDLDFGSIMMYSPYSFSINGQPTITKLNGSTYSVQRTALSAGDLYGLNIMYPSTETTPTYINGEYYTISGLTVLRYNDLWYLRTKYGFKRVELRNNRWYWV